VLKLPQILSRLPIVLALAAAGLACFAADIPTAQYDNSRTLWNASETILRTANVNQSSFGKLFTTAVDGWVYAQPLYLENMNIPGRGVMNVLYVATMHNTVYALDADNPNATAVWSTNLGAPDTTTGFFPDLGILSTPVIVREKQALYAVATNFENGHRIFRLHALDLLTGVEIFGGPAVIGGQTPGQAADAVNGVLIFNPDQHRQRTSLAVANNSVFFAMAGLSPRPFHGWIFGYDTSTLQQTGVYCDTANGEVGGIWTSGRAPAVDTAGNLYIETGDGDFDGVTDFGDAILKFSTSAGLQLTDWFVPDNWSTLDVNDWDLGSSTPTLIAGANRMVGGSKAGWLYVLDTTNLGHLAAGNGQIVQAFQPGAGCASNSADSCVEIHGQVYWNHSTNPMLYIWAWRDVMKAYPLSGGQLDRAHLTNGTMISNYPSAFLAGSSNGSAPGSGIIWAITADLSNAEEFESSAGTLRAFDAGDITRELWNSAQNAPRDSLGNFAKFVSPVVANGKVYMATTANQLVVYGLLPAPSLTIGKSHTGSFTAGQQNATYTIAVSNATGAGPTSGVVTVTENLPSGLSLVSMAGAGWSCGSGACTRSDPLAGGSSYSQIMVTVNVAANASSPQFNQVTVSGGGAAASSTTDPAIITAGASSSSAAFVSMDTATHGNWRGVYGGDGYMVVGDTASNPSYVTPAPSGQNLVVWTSSTSDARALQKGSNASDRIAAAWWSGSSFTVDLPIADTSAHRVALYCLDWDTAARRQTVDILDPNGNVLSSQSLTGSFNGGVYLVWNVSGHVRVRVTVTGGANPVLSGLFFGGAGSGGNPATGAASFVQVDTATRGNWHGVYGADGYTVVGDTATNPAYVTPAPAGQGLAVWASSTSDIRAPQKGSNPSDRIAAAWYSGSSFTVDLPITDSNTHLLALYCLDWDTTARRETVDILDGNGTVLSSQSLTGGFNGGTYLVWNVAGHVKVRVTVTGGVNPVLSGLFFGGTGSSGNPAPGSASFVQMDTVTRGDWHGVYGGDGFTVVGDTESDPTYVTPAAAGQSLAVWTSSTSDTRALQKGSNPSGRIAATWYAGNSFTVDLPITDGNTHRLALYCIDWDTTARRQTVDILDGNGNVLNSQSLTGSFSNGVYLVWNVAGHVKVRVTLAGGANPVLSGLFFGGAGAAGNPGTAAFVSLDSATQGNWHGVYGLDGYTVLGDQASNPSYVTPAAAGQNPFTWAGSSSDVRALEKPSNLADRVAGGWYTGSAFTVDLPIADASMHQLAVYCLDWDTTSRRQTVDILDANGNVLNSQSLTSSFNGGVYLLWNVSGHVKLRVTLTGGANAVISGLFFR
jgi:uncharacterized repeat protein (TIGR01451 family)